MRTAEHLASVVDRFGPAFATGTIVDLIETGLKAANDAQQAHRAEEKGTTDKVNPYVTDILKCEKAVYKTLRNEEPSDPLTSDSLINFGVGHAVEEWLTSVLEVQGAEVLREIRVEIPVNDTVVTGRADFLVTIPAAKLLIELKTTSSRAMGYIVKQGANGQQGREEHRRQINLYLHASHLGLLDQPYETGLLCYVVKDATRGEPVAHAFDVRYDKIVAQADLNSLSLVKQWADLEVEPPIPAEYTRNKFPCSYCSFRRACWDNWTVSGR